MGIGCVACREVTQPGNMTNAVIAEAWIMLNFFNLDAYGWVAAVPCWHKSPEHSKTALSA